MRPPAACRPTRDRAGPRLPAETVEPGRTVEPEGTVEPGETVEPSGAPQVGDALPTPTVTEGLDAQIGAVQQIQRLLLADQLHVGSGAPTVGVQHQLAGTADDG